MLTASRLFYSEGMRGVGVDRLIAESSVAKRSFYHHFPSKTALVIAWLTRRHEEWMAQFTADCEGLMAEGGRGRGLEVLADALAMWFRRPGYRGCAFINVIAESGTSPDPLVRAVAVRHKEELGQWVVGLAERLGVARPLEAAMRAMILMDGMIVRYQMTGDAAVIDDGRDLLAALSSPRRARRLR